MTLPRDESRRCAGCGAYLSVHALAHERYCWPCRPEPERKPRLCAHGHELTVYAIANGVGKWRCGRCIGRR